MSASLALPGHLAVREREPLARHSHLWRGRPGRPLGRSARRGRPRGGARRRRSDRDAPHGGGPRHEPAGCRRRHRRPGGQQQLRRIDVRRSRRPGARRVGTHDGAACQAGRRRWARGARIRDWSARHGRRRGVWQRRRLGQRTSRRCWASAEVWYPDGVRQLGPDDLGLRLSAQRLANAIPSRRSCSAPRLASSPATRTR